MPPLSRHSLEADPDFDASLLSLLAELDLSTAPEASAAARDALRAASREDRLDLAVQVFEGALPVDRIAECVFVSAALQVRLAGQAARLDTKTLKPVADGVCPCCGGAPVASVIVSWTPADKARYLSCSLCGTYWNHVRIRCTACGDGEGVSYYGLDEVSKDVQVETCTTCHSYIKHLHQHRAPALDPVADDIASYGLDLKIAKDGFRRAGLNLLFVI
ncbi:formate dehydrogenase accessory protein FdhE [Methylobacterium sp. NMS12]